MWWLHTWQRFSQVSHIFHITEPSVGSTGAFSHLTKINRGGGRGVYLCVSVWVVVDRFKGFKASQMWECPQQERNRGRWAGSGCHLLFLFFNCSEMWSFFSFSHTVGRCVCPTPRSARKKSQLHSSPISLTVVFLLCPQWLIYKEAINSLLTITLIDKGLKLKETLTLMREIGGDRQWAVLPSPLISQDQAYMHIDKLNKRRMRMGRRLKDLFYKYFSRPGRPGFNETVGPCESLMRFPERYINSSPSATFSCQI